ARDQQEDQPHVVGLPDRRHRGIDQRAGLPAGLPAAGEKVPQAGAVVGQTGPGVEGHRDHQDDRDAIGGGHDPACPTESAAGSAAARAPYDPASSALSCRRHLADIARSTTTVAMPSAVYSVATAAKLTQIPSAAVTASSVRTML